MSADFLDTNVLVYAYDVGEPEKRSTAQRLLKRALAGEMIISAQVLAEFAATLLHKARPAASDEEMIDILRDLSPIKLVGADADMVRRAVDAHAAYGLHFYDGMIVAAAERARCERIWSEDFNHGQKYFGVTVANPFA